jgi:hypothetical protein
MSSEHQGAGRCILGMYPKGECWASAAVGENARSESSLRAGDGKGERASTVEQHTYKTTDEGPATCCCM